MSAVSPASLRNAPVIGFFGQRERARRPTVVFFSLSVSVARLAACSFGWWFVFSRSNHPRSCFAVRQVARVGWGDSWHSLPRLLLLLYHPSSYITDLSTSLRFSYLPKPPTYPQYQPSNPSPKMTAAITHPESNGSAHVLPEGE